MKLLLLFNLAVLVSCQPLLTEQKVIPDLSQIYDSLAKVTQQLLTYIRETQTLSEITSIHINTNESSHKVLITTGYPWDGETIIIDLQNDEVTCTLPAYPLQLANGAGGIIEDEIPLICGGYKSSKYFPNCYTLTDKTWTEIGKLETGQSSMGTGNIVVNGSLLLTGGTGTGNIPLNSMVMIDSGSMVEVLKEMPNHLVGHCNVRLNSSHIMVMGGNSDDDRSTSDTLIFDLVNQEWTQGPSMKGKRENHGCIQMLLGDQPIIWVTGGENGARSLQTTEYLEDLDQGWQPGPDLPYKLDFHRMVASEDLETIYITGGSKALENGEILQLQCSGSTPDTCSFATLTLDFDVIRFAHIALPVSNTLADKLCN